MNKKLPYLAALGIMLVATGCGKKVPERRYNSASGQSRKPSAPMIMMNSSYDRSDIDSRHEGWREFCLYDKNNIGGK